MLGCLVMGMGVPLVTAYLILAIVMGPALEKLGVPTIAAHLFMLYFGVLSVVAPPVAPPVALAAFAAAPNAGAKSMETGFTIAGLFWAILIFAISTWMIATGVGSYQNDPIPLWNAGLRVITGLVVLHPQFEISAIAAGLASSAHAEEIKMAAIARGTSAYLTMTTMATIINQACAHNISFDATGVVFPRLVSSGRKPKICPTSARSLESCRIINGTF